MGSDQSRRPVQLGMTDGEIIRAVKQSGDLNGVVKQTVGLRYECGPPRRGKQALPGDLCTRHDHGAAVWPLPKLEKRRGR